MFRKHVNVSTLALCEHETFGSPGASLVLPIKHAGYGVLGALFGLCAAMRLIGGRELYFSKLDPMRANAQRVDGHQGARTRGYSEFSKKYSKSVSVKAPKCAALARATS